MMKKLTELKSLESLKSIKLKLPNFPSLLKKLKSKKTSDQPQQPKSIKFDKAKTAKAASSVVLFGFSGWFLWHTFLAVPEPALPPSLPPSVATINPAPIEQSIPLEEAPVELVDAEMETVIVEQAMLNSPDEMIDELLTITGWYKQADDIPKHIIQGAEQAAAQDSDPDPVALMKVKQMATDAFQPDAFKSYLYTSLKNNFDQARAERLLQSFHQPWLQRITQLEQQDIQPDALQTFVAGLTDTSLSDKRIALFQQYDDAAQLTEYMVELSSGIIRAMLNGAVKNDHTTMASFDHEINRNQAQMHENMREQVFVLLAYIYRELTDDEFAAYVEFTTSDDGMWLNKTLMQAALEKLNSGALYIGQQLAELCNQSDPCADQPASPQSVTKTLTALDVPENQQPQQYALTARSNLDARECLNLTDNMAIHRCAENFR